VSRPGLTEAQNERVRELIQGLRTKGDNQIELARKLAMTQGGLSSFLSRRNGTTYLTAMKLAVLLGRPTWEVLGEPPPDIASIPPRELAVMLARQIGVGQESIAAALAEPETKENAGWPAIYWTDWMRTHHLDRLQARPEPVRPKKKL
jgi:DNA transposition AAA+ family ATPase